MWLAHSSDIWLCGVIAGAAPEGHPSGVAGDGLENKVYES
jgi:hypothetical protein